METKQCTRFPNFNYPGFRKYPGMKFSFILYFIMLQTAFFSLSLSAQYCEMEKEILNAYQTRISGDSKNAVVLLTAVLDKDSTNALANFEMARSLENMDKWKYIDKAILYDPQNPMYVFYKANMYMLEAYVAMHNNDKEATSLNVEHCCKTLNKVLEINPGCRESLLFLVDLYGNLPEDMGGNPALAKMKLETLRSVDPVYTVEGEIILSKDTINPDDYWEKYITENGECEEAMIRMGKSNLMRGDIEKATNCFEKIIEKNQGKKILYLEIARAHLYKAMRGGPDENSELEEIQNYIHKYLTEEESKPVNIEAWCYAWLSRIEQRLGNDALAKEYIEKASELTDNIPMYTALPEVDDPPNVIKYNYKSYFRPF